jgi:hypothetical protein
MRNVLHARSAPLIGAAIVVVAATLVSFANAENQVSGVDC